MSLGNFDDSDPGRQPERTTALLVSAQGDLRISIGRLLLLICFRLGSCRVTTTLEMPPLGMLREWRWACVTAFPKFEGDPANSFTSAIPVGNLS